MKPILKFTALIILAGATVLLSCKKEYSCEGCRGDNKPPVANAGPDQVITLPTDSVMLDGSTSSDPDGMISSYHWTKISGPAPFNILKPADSITKVKTLGVGVYQFELKVADNGGLSVKDTMSVRVDAVATTNHPPIANAGADQTITLPTNSTSLEGSASTDPDNNIVSYLWTKISGPSSFNIASVNAVQTQVSNLVEGTYLFELKVTDAGGLLSNDTIQIVVQPVVSPPLNCDISNRPVSNAGFSLSAQLPEPRYGIAVATVGNKIFIAGGSTSNTGNQAANLSNRVDIYDVTTSQWAVTQLSEPCIVGAVVVLGNKIFFAGGWNVNGDRTTIDIYDVSANSWSTAQLSKARASLSGGAVDNKIIFAGGLVTSPAGGIYYNIDESNVVDIYNAVTNSWSTTSLSEARHGTFVTTVGQKIFLAGGQNCWIQDCPTNKIDIYDAVTNTWSHENYTPLNTGGYLAYLFSGISSGNKNYWVTGDYWVGGSLVEIRDETTHTTKYECLSGILNGNPIRKDNKLIFPVHTPLTNKLTQFDVYDLAANTWSISKLPLGGTDHKYFVSMLSGVYAVGGSFPNPTIGGLLYDNISRLNY